MAFYTTPRRILGSLMALIRTQFNTSRNVIMFKATKGNKSNIYTTPQRQPLFRFRKGNYRRICQSCFRLDGVCIKPKSVLNLGATRQFIDESRSKDSYIIPIARHFTKNWRLYTQAKEPGSPAPSKGGPVKSSGGGVGKLDAAHESGFFHKVNKSRLDQIKQMLKDKSMLSGGGGCGKDSRAEPK